MAASQVFPGLKLHNSLALESCPHCGVVRPYVAMSNPYPQGHWLETITPDGKRRAWGIYACSSCGKVVVATGDGGPNSQVTEVYPVPKSVAEEIPEEPKRFLAEALTCLHAPSAAIMCCASAVDAMLKEKGYEKGWLNDRIDKAVADHLLTQEMGDWAHHIRLEANDQRHADKSAGAPTRERAEQAIEFTEALADIMFVLPSRVKRGIKRAQQMIDSSASVTAAGTLIQTESS